MIEEKIYRTKMSDGSSFRVVKIEMFQEKISRIMGHYIRNGKEWDVLCPISQERLFIPQEIGAFTFGTQFNGIQTYTKLKKNATTN
jgi:hypothetical protein